MRRIIDVKCHYCGKDLKRGQRHNKYGYYCRGCWNKENGFRRIKTYRKCQQCGKEFRTYPSNIKRGNGKFCSRKCHFKYNIGKPSPCRGRHWKQKNRKPDKFIKCKICGKEFITHSWWKNRQYCGMNCYMKINSERMRKWCLSKIKYKTKEEKRLVMLKFGRESYRRHIKTRLFYYRNLSFKRRNAIGKFTLIEWEKKKKEFGYKCAICGILEEELLNKTGMGLTIDHIIPISKKGMNNIENIQPLCKSCNSRKSNNCYQKIK